MAYNLGVRFPPPPKYYTLLDPGAYYSDESRNKQNAAPFLSKAPRKTLEGATLWTQAIYDQSLPSNIPNCASMRSKKPRFPYEAFSAEDLEEMLCKCGIVTCECPTGQETEEDIVLCQGKARRRLFKGTVLRSLYGSGGLSTSARKKQACPPFYDARVNESTAFYQGWKWSKRTAKDRKDKEVRPGPTHYSLEREPTEFEICAEKFRAFKRKTSKQLRFIEMVQQRTILENRPSPATYYPKSPRGTELNFLGSKNERFPKGQYDIRPGPADHWLRRDFDAIEPPDQLCHAKLPEPACFGVKAKRFKALREEGASPASYTINNRTNFDGCHAPFGSSAERFKKEIIEESDDDEIVELYEEGSKATTCERPTWEFKSKTIRTKPLFIKYDEPSPADFLQNKSSVKKTAVPFSSSEERFMPWYSWLPVHALLETPGPGYYNAEKSKCFPAFKRGPLYRAQRFPNICHNGPSPNAYEVNNGIETVLATHNTRLKSNIKKDQYETKNKREVPRVLTFAQRERVLFDKCIACLDTEPDEKEEEKSLEKNVPVTPKTKLLKCFLYAHPVQNTF